MLTHKGPSRKKSSRKGSTHKVPLRKLPSRQLPCRALQLIREYSKPITRGDWRTCSRINLETYVKDKDKLNNFTNTRHLYGIVHRNMYERLYRMSESELYWLIIHQFNLIKYHTIIPINDMTRIEMIYAEIQNEEIMKQPNYKQKKFFKNNQELMKLYEKTNSKLYDFKFRKKNGNTYY